MTRSARTDVQRADAEADAARYRLKRTLDEIKGRLAPSAIAETAREEVADAAGSVARKGAALVRRHPVKVIGGGALVLALAARRFLRKRKRRREATR